MGSVVGIVLGAMYSKVLKLQVQGDSEVVSFCSILEKLRRGMTSLDNFRNRRAL